MIISFQSPIRIRSNELSKASRWFITVPKEYTSKILEFASQFPKKRGRGSLRVEARIGASKWKTSVFPSKPHEAYLLAVKKEIRQECHISEHDEIFVELKFLDW